MRSLAVLLLPLAQQLDGKLGSGEDSGNHHGQQDTFGYAGKGRFQWDRGPAVRPPPTIVIAAPNWEL